MAQKRISEAALKNVLETAVELLQDAEDAGSDGMVMLSNSVYMRLSNGGKAATGVTHGIAASDESDVDDEEEDDEDDEDQPDEDDR